MASTSSGRPSSAGSRRCPTLPYTGAMTARVTRAILRHDAVTDAALWARLRRQPDAGRQLAAENLRPAGLSGGAADTPRQPCVLRRRHGGRGRRLPPLRALLRAAYDVWKSAANSGIQGTWSRSSSDRATDSNIFIDYNILITNKEK